jgi:hypothetical protein
MIAVTVAAIVAVIHRVWTSGFVGIVGNVLYRRCLICLL